MSTILSIPLETFSAIIGLLDTTEVARLWACCNNTITWRLSNGNAVRKIEISGNDGIMARWPSLVAHLNGLETFRHCNAYSDQLYPLTAIDLSILPQKLKKMELESISGIKALNDLFASNPSCFPHLESLSLPKLGSIHIISFTIPSTLHSLHLGSRRLPLSSFSLDILPPYLTELSICFLKIELPSGSTKFPETLKTAHLHSIGPSSFFHLLPQSLEDLGYQFIGSSSNFKHDWSAISQLEIKKLNLSVFGVFTVQEALQLPRTLEEIVLEVIVSEMTPAWTLSILEALPQNLKVLRGVWPRVITVEVAKSMPPTLTWSSSEHVLAESVAFMPPNTVSLDLRLASNFHTISSFPAFLQKLVIPRISHAMLSMLPDSLRDLTLLETGTTLNRTKIELMPRKLRYLRVKRNSILSLDSLESVKALPPNLESLKLIQAVTGQNKDFIDLLPTPPESALWFPRTLKVLEIGCIESPPAQWFCELPSTLVSLELLLNTVNISSMAHLRSHYILRTLTIQVMSTPDGKWTDSLEKLPIKLETLEFRDHSSNAETCLDNASFLLLPRTITNISLPKSPLLNEECNWRHLKFLTDLRINHSVPLWFGK